MPDDVDPAKGTTLDGVMPPENDSAQPPANRKKMLIIVLAAGGACLVFTLFFALYLMAVLPDPEGRGQTLRAIGNAYYGGISVLAAAFVALFTLRLLRGGLEPKLLPQALMRPGVAAIAVIGVSAMVFLTINGEIQLPIDVLEPANLNGLTAPVTVTFGTDSLRNILRNQGVAPRQYKWDFNGDGQTDADTQDVTVTTIYERKGVANVVLRMLLSNGKVRSAHLRLTIPNVVFSLEPTTPILRQEAEFDVSDLLSDPTKVENIQWDFNGDGTMDVETTEPIVRHAFMEIGTFTIQATIQYIGGLRETYSRTVTVLEKPEQPFLVEIKTQGETTGSIPIGVIFTASAEEGIVIQSYDWHVAKVRDDGKQEKGEQRIGENMHEVFADAGEYLVTLTATDNRGRKAMNSIAVHALEQLVVKDVVIGGTPNPSRNTIEGTAPLDVRLTASTDMPFITFTWEQEGATAVYSSDESYRALYKDQGTYRIVLIAHDEQERTQKIPLEVRVQPPRSNIAFTAMPATGIAPINVTFDASESFIPDGRITGFAWTFGDGKEREEKPQLLGAKATHKYETEGTYTVIVRALTEDGRSFDARKTIVVRSPTLNACIFPSRTNGIAPMGVQFDASCSTGTVQKYLWTFGDGATSEQTEPVQDHVFDHPGAFTVLLEVSDATGNSDQSSVTITVYPASQ